MNVSNKKKYIFFTPFQTKSLYSVVKCYTKEKMYKTKLLLFL